MRRVTLSLLVIMSMTFALASSVSAGGNPPPPLSSGFQLQNRSTTATATVSIAFYNAAGTIVQTKPDTIPANGSKSYFVPNVLSQPDGRYSVVVSSDQPLFSLVNEVTSGSTSPFVGASHNGFTDSDIGSPLYLPWVVVGYYNYNSMFGVQNAGASATTITVEFFQSGQSSPVRTYPFTNVAPGAAVFLDMTQDPYKSQLQGTTSVGFAGAVKISSTGNATPLAAVLNDTNPTGTFLRSYNAVKGGSTDLIAPQVSSNYYGYMSGITLQNPSTSQTASASVKFYQANATTPATTMNVTIAPSSAKPIYLPNVPGMPNPFNGSAVVHSNIPLTGIANHDHIPSGPAASYNMEPLSSAAQTLYMPQIARAYYGYETGYQLYNVGPGTVSVAVTFTDSAGNVKATINHSIAPGATLAYYLGDSRGAALGTMFNGGAKATITSGSGGLIGIANFQAPTGPDNMRTYNLFH